MRCARSALGMVTATVRRILLLLLIATCIVLPLKGSNLVQADSTVNVTRHAQLGFQISQGFSTTFEDDIESIGHYTFDIMNGSINLTVNTGVDIEFSYDRSKLVPGGTLPVSIKYTPTNDAGPEFTFSMVADVGVDVDVLGMDAIEDTLYGFTLASGSGDFKLPLTGDPDIPISLSSSQITVELLGIDLAKVQLTGTFTLSPVATGDLPGLGGGAAIVSVTGGTLSPLQLPILEWQSAGQTVVVNVAVEDTGTLDLKLQPVMHWVGTYAQAQANVDLLGLLDTVFGDPDPKVIIDEGLGPRLDEAGLDDELSAAVVELAGPMGEVAGPKVAERIVAGFVPIPLLDPPLALIPPMPSFGTVALNIDTDADDDGLLDGVEMTGTNPTNPYDPDSDDDGLLDGQEDSNHNGTFDTGETNPNDADTDNDGLLDGIEVLGSNPTNPLVADTDGDGLLDGQEDSNHNGTLDLGETDPNNPDTDADGLSDGVELETGMDPLDPDSDDDGIVDGEDSEWLQNAIRALPDSAFKGIGNRTAMLSQLDNIEKLVLTGKTDQAIKELQLLRQHVDGFGVTADKTDWIIEYAAQLTIRGFIDVMISNLSS